MFEGKITIIQESRVAKAVISSLIDELFGLIINACHS